MEEFWNWKPAEAEWQGAEGVSEQSTFLILLNSNYQLIILFLWNKYQIAS